MKYGIHSINNLNQIYKEKEHLCTDLFYIISVELYLNSLDGVVYDIKNDISLYLQFF